MQVEMFAAKRSPTKSCEDFETRAFEFLSKFSRSYVGTAFSPEFAVVAAMEQGIVPIDGRRWGAVFLAVQEAGYIQPSTELFSRKSSNGSRRPGWIGV